MSYKIRNEHHSSKYAHSVFYSLYNTLFLLFENYIRPPKQIVVLESTLKNMSITINIKSDECTTDFVKAIMSDSGIASS